MDTQPPPAEHADARHARLTRPVPRGLRGVRHALDLPASSTLAPAKGAAAPDDAAKHDYPMDFYANASLGPWTPRHGLGSIRKAGRNHRALLQALGLGPPRPPAAQTAPR